MARDLNKVIDGIISKDPQIKQTTLRLKRLKKKYELCDSKIAIAKERLKAISSFQDSTNSADRLAYQSADLDYKTFILEKSNLALLITCEEDKLSKLVKEMEKQINDPEILSLIKKLYDIKPTQVTEVEQQEKQ